MKNLLVALVIFSSLLSAQAEITEANIIIQVKLFTKLPDSTNNGITKLSYHTSSYKTIDFIQRIAQEQGQPAFSNKARLIHQVTYEAGGAPTHKYIIRDKDRADYSAETPFSVTLEGNPVEKGKITETENTGTIARMNASYCRLKPDTSTEEILFMGLNNQNSRIIQSKDFDRLLRINTITLKGVGSYNYTHFSAPTDFGHSQGTFKLSAPKIIRTPGP